ncbi:MAG: dTDP-4-dehydrorhamnose 3,5-epimerase [Bacteroidota bacterium]
MKGQETALKDCWVLEPDVFEDKRGFFYEGFNAEKFEAITGLNFTPKQLNQSGSVRGVLRGLHFQLQPKAQAKLINCIQGELLDVAVDLRKNSPTFKQHIVVRLSDENKKLLYVPKGFAHGFQVLSDYAKLIYQVDEVYSSAHDSGIAYDDPHLNISWIGTESEIILSNRDRQLKNLSETEINF